MKSGACWTVSDNDFGCHVPERLPLGDMPRCKFYSSVEFFFLSKKNEKWTNQNGGGGGAQNGAVGSDRGSVSRKDDEEILRCLSVSVFW